MLAMDNIPFPAKPIKAHYMWRNIERHAEMSGIPWSGILTYPLKHLPFVNRIALVGVVAARRELRHRQYRRLHFSEQPTALRGVYRSGVNLASGLAFRTEQVTQRQPHREPGLAVSSRLAVDADARPPVIDLADELDLPGQEPHALARAHALGDREPLQEGDHAVGAVEPGFAPRLAALAPFGALFAGVD
jgi:hypothetical protein